MNKKTGSCHCGAVKFEIPFSGEFQKLRRCDCSLCSKKWAVVASVPFEDFKILEGAEHLTLYRWNTKIAKHYFCSICGIYTHHRRRSNPKEFGVNIACFQDTNVRDYQNVKYVDGQNHPKDQPNSTIIIPSDSN